MQADPGIYVIISTYNRAEVRRETLENCSAMAVKSCYQAELAVMHNNSIDDFAHPYTPWKRGAKENLNGHIRQFFQKKLRFDSMTPHQFAFAMHRLNHRPRKCLGFKTPQEVVTQLKSRHNVFALLS